MIDEISKSIIRYNFYSTIYVTAAGAFLGMLLVMAPVVPVFIRFTSIAVLIVIALMVFFVSVIRRLTNVKASHYLDKISPSIRNILSIGGQYVILIVIMCLATYMPARLLAAADVITMSSWIMGISATMIWYFSFEVLSFYTTQYSIDSKGLLIIQRINSIFLPLENLESVGIVSSTEISWERKLRTRSLFIIGIRSAGQFIMIKWKPKNFLIERFVPEIYITPTSPKNFYEIIQGELESIKTKSQETLKHE